MSRAAYLALPYREFCLLCGCTLTEAQDLITRVVFDGEPIDPTNELQVQLFGGCFPIPRLALGTFLAICGGRGGKSYTLIALRVLQLALIVDLSILAPGEFGFGLIVAPDKDLAGQTLRYAIGAAGALRLDHKSIGARDGGTLTIYFEGITREIDVVAATRGGGAVRARTLFAFAMDEFCLFRTSDQGVVNDKEIFNAGSPRVLPDGQTLLGSTPMFEEGLGFELHEENFGHPVTAIAVHAPTVVLRKEHPYILEMVAREYAKNPENAARELGAKFVPANTGHFFELSTIAAAVDLDASSAPAGERLTGAIDLGVRTHVGCLVCVERRGGVLVVVRVDVKRPDKGETLTPRAYLDAFGESLRSIGGELAAVSPAQLGEAMARRSPTSELELVPGFAETEAVEALLYLRTLLRSGQLRLPNDPSLLVQLREVRAALLPVGGIEVSLSKTTAGRADLLLTLAHAVWSDRRHGPVVDEEHEIVPDFTGFARRPLGGYGLRDPGVVDVRAAAHADVCPWPTTIVGTPTQEDIDAAEWEYHRDRGDRV